MENTWIPWIEKILNGSMVWCHTTRIKSWKIFWTNTCPGFERVTLSLRFLRCSPLATQMLLLKCKRWLVPKYLVEMELQIKPGTFKLRLLVVSTFIYNYGWLSYFYFYTLAADQASHRMAVQPLPPPPLPTTHATIRVFLPKIFCIQSLLSSLV